MNFSLNKRRRKQKERTKSRKNFSFRRKEKKNKREKEKGKKILIKKKKQIIHIFRDILLPFDEQDIKFTLNLFTVSNKSYKIFEKVENVVNDEGKLSRSYLENNVVV